jgi:hypothetical protein
VDENSTAKTCIDDRSLVEHLATKVMGWDERERLICQHGPHPFGLDSWADAGTVWGKARERGIELHLVGSPRHEWEGRYVPETSMYQINFANSGPRAICLAVARATNWDGEEDVPD